MPLQVSYKKQFTLMVMLLVTLLIVVEIFVNIWLYNFYRCDFEQSEIFKTIDKDEKRKICLENIGRGDRILTKEIGTAERYVSEMKFVHINSDGFRNPTEITKEKPENTFRIFTIGGSTTFGNGVLDDQTFPFYLQKIFDNSDLGFKVQVINAGWPLYGSLFETEMIKNKLLAFEPDLFIIFDGVNELNLERENDDRASAVLWKNRWSEICDLGKQYGFDTIVTLQPIAGAGKKVLSNQEYAFYIQKDGLKLLEPYPSYVEKLEELKNACSLTADLTGLFDLIEEPIYFDIYHAGPTGNRIIAEKFYQLSLQAIMERIEGEDFSDTYASSLSKINAELIYSNQDDFLEEFYLTIRDLVFSYKTPRIFSVIFEK